MLHPISVFGLVFGCAVEIVVCMHCIMYLVIMELLTSLFHIVRKQPVRPYAINVFKYR